MTNQTTTPTDAHDHSFMPDGQCRFAGCEASPIGDELDNILPELLKRSADKGFVQKQDVQQAKQTVNAYILAEVLKIVGENEHFEGSHKEKSYDTYLNAYKAELRQALTARFGGQE